MSLKIPESWAFCTSLPPPSNTVGQAVLDPTICSFVLTAGMGLILNIIQLNYFPT